MQDITKHLRERIDQFVALRRDLHQHPELAFQETRTSAIVANKLHEFGYEVTERIGKTGVVGTLKAGSGKKSLGIRADMDALPIQEMTNLSYASKYENVMHACGHDGHTASLLAAAQTIAERRKFNGTVNLIFQPAEEIGSLNSGSSMMLREGLFERFPCDVIYGLHNMPGLPSGEFHFKQGSFMAASDTAHITLKARGGHAAKPHMTPDPVVAAASIICALQTIISRSLDPLKSAVVTVGAIHGGSVANIIPQRVDLKLSIRTFDPDIRDMCEQKIGHLVNTQADSFGVEAKIEYERGYAATVNNKASTDFAVSVAKKLSQSVVYPTEPVMVSEDFAFMLEKVPGTYLFLGNGDEQGHNSSSVHTPQYDFNDEIILPAAAYWTALTEEYLS